MSRIDLQPDTALVGITTAEHAGAAVAVAEAAAGPIATGAMSMIDAAAGIAEFMAVGEEEAHAAVALGRTVATGAAATSAVTDLVAIDEANRQQLRAVGGDV